MATAGVTPEIKAQNPKAAQVFAFLQNKWTEMGGEAFQIKEAILNGKGNIDGLFKKVVFKGPTTPPVTAVSGLGAIPEEKKSKLKDAIFAMIDTNEMELAWVIRAFQYSRDIQRKRLTLSDATIARITDVRNTLATIAAEAGITATEWSAKVTEWGRNNGYLANTFGTVTTEQQNATNFVNGLDTQLGQTVSTTALTIAPSVTATTTTTAPTTPTTTTEAETSKTPLYVGGALVAAAGLYFVFRKKVNKTISGLFGAPRSEKPSSKPSYQKGRTSKKSKTGTKTVTI